MDFQIDEKFDDVMDFSNPDKIFKQMDKKLHSRNSNFVHL